MIHFKNITFFCIWFVVILISCISDENTRNDLAILGLNGPVKSIEIIPKNDTSIISDDLMFSYNRMYHNSDEVKRYLIHRTYKPALLSNQIYTFDENGFTKDSVFVKNNIKFPVDSPKDSLHVFENGRIVSMIDKYRDTKYEVDYNDQGYIIALRERDIKYKPGNLLGTQKYDYDKNGIMVKTDYLYPRSSGMKESHYEIKPVQHDSFDNWIKATFIYGVIGREMNQFTIERVIEYY